MAKIVLPKKWNRPEYVFETVDEWPLGYTVWNIGNHAELSGAGYIPLCQSDANYHINPATLKAFKVGDSLICERVMKAAGQYEMTREKFIRFMKSDYEKFD